MSWQRILETARRNGFPIVVTDIAGREPMVVMPLDTFEAMTSVDESAGSQFEYQAFPDPGAAMDEGFFEELAEMPEELLGDSPMQEAPEGAAESPSGEGKPSMTEDLALEDRFFLEPVDEEQN